MTGVWKTWMTVWCWGVIVFGAAIATAGFAATDTIARAIFDLIGARSHGPDLFASPAMRLSAGLMGAVTMGWGLALLAVARAGAGAEVWRAITSGMLIWYAVDSAISVATGYPLNAASNTLFLGAYLAIVAGGGAFRRA